jgi:hypothetical protein
VFAYGNTTDNKTYTLSNDVTNVQSKLLYYRLCSVDIVGKSKLSEVRIIRIGKQNEMLSMITYPDPVNSELRITVPAACQNKEVVLGVYNLNGQMVRH